ncbi:hypothetical protein VTN31DRAFT_1579 [Thermomyces dupontii]|uniref:uncharacterized protein n=1 Tax=Talaromyces thermophilus TaxID=28565 RepID=UPI0037420974
MRQKHFALDPTYRPLNHGSFGTYPLEVKTAFRRYQEENESRPDYFFYRTRPRRVNEARQAVASLLHADVRDCVFVKNATTGVNIVLRNLQYEPGDVVIYFATVYGAVLKTLLSLQETTPLQTRKVEYALPLTHDEIVQRFLEVANKARAEGLKVRAAVFDTIVSVPGVRFPFEKLTRACKDEGILSVIDGAHGVGQIPINLSDLDPDFFVSNCHKWLYTPRGCAVFYVAKRNQHLIKTSFPTSHGYIVPEDRANPPVPGGKTPFEHLFDFVGTNDDSPYMCIPEALKFRNEICGGEDAIMDYCQRIAHEGAEVVARILGTEVMREPGVSDLKQSDLCRCAMINVRTPLAVANDTTVSPHVPDPSTSPYQAIDRKDVRKVQDWLQSQLLDQYNAFAKFDPQSGWMWIRLSGQIYLELEDFEWFGNVAKSLCERAGKGEWLSSEKDISTF